MIKIRRFEEQDWKTIWQIVKPVFRAGDTYAFSPQITETEAYRIWIELPTATFTAIDEHGLIIGTYYIKPNQAGPGSHVCNCGFIVDSKARGKGGASQMCEHSQREAINLGFRAMQFNMVVSTNKGAVRLWKKHGYDVIGTLPQAFHHPQLGFVDALIMYKHLAI